MRVRLADEDDPLSLDSGISFFPIDVEYETYGALSPGRDNAVLIAHALSGDAHAAGWCRAADALDPAPEPTGAWSPAEFLAGEAPPETGEGEGVPTTPVYFVPQDQNNSCTVIFLYNTSDTNGTVRIQSWETDGTEEIDTTVSVPAHHMVRVCSDSVVSLWPDAVLVNFRSSSAYARMLLPEGVKADAFVAWNGSNPYSPEDALPTLHIRFSTDPESVYLPAVLNE